jgi:hypothetical protein
MGILPQPTHIAIGAPNPTIWQAGPLSRAQVAGFLAELEDRIRTAGLPPHST